MNSILNQLKFYRLALMIANNSGELQKDSQAVSSAITKAYGALSGCEKGTGTLLNIAKISCGFEKYTTFEPETVEKITDLLHLFDKAESIVEPETVKKFAKRQFENLYPEYRNKKFAYFQSTFNTWIMRDSKRKDMYSGGVLEDVDMKLQLDVQVDEKQVAPDLQFK